MKVITGSSSSRSHSRHLNNPDQEVVDNATKFVQVNVVMTVKISVKVFAATNKKKLVGKVTRIRLFVEKRLKPGVKQALLKERRML